MAPVAGLCCRGGWTRGLIDKLLGEPDKLARNPHYASAAPMRLYLLERVAEVEQTPEYQTALAKLGPRREAPKAAAATRMAAAAVRAAAATERQQAQLAELRQRIDTAEIEITMVDPKTIEHAAFESYYVHGGEVPRRQGGPEFQPRVIQNYMRHELSNYDDLLDEFMDGSRLDDWGTYTAVRTRVEHALEAAYSAVGYSYFTAAVITTRLNSGE
jgi:hypothetical protein